MRVNIDLTKTNSDNDIADELLNNVGASAFTLEHDFFYGSTDLRIWTAAGETGTQLVETTDYDLGGIDSDLTTRAGVNIYSTITVTNVTYQTGDLYFTYHACADFVDAFDRYSVVRGSGSTLASMIMSATGTIEFNSGSPAPDSFEVNSAGGIELYLTGTQGFYIEDSTNFSYFYMDPETGSIQLGAEGTGGFIDLYSDLSFISIAAATDIDIDAGEDLNLSSGNGNINLESGADLIVNTYGDGNTVSIISNKSSTPVLNNRISSIIIDQQTALIVETTIDSSSGTGANLVLQTSTTDGGATSGNIVIQNASGPGPAGNIQITTENNTSAAIDINAPDGGIDVDTDSFTLDTTSSNFNSVAINATAGGVYIVPAGNFIVEGSSNVDLANDVGDSILINTSSRHITLEQDQGAGGGTGAGIRLFTNVNNAGGTSGDVHIKTDAISGTSGRVRIDSNSVLSTAIDIDTTGGLDIDTDEGITINDDSGSSIVFNTVGLITLTSGGISGVTIQGGSGTANIDSTSGRARVQSGRSNAQAVHLSAYNASGGVDIDANSGGIDMDASEGAISMTSTYTGAGTGPNVTIETDVNNASGTGGNIVVQATATSGTEGYTSLLGDVRLPTSAPSNPGAGSVYFNAGTDTLFIYNGTAWVSEVLTV